MLSLELQILLSFIKFRTCRYIKLEVLQLQRKQHNDDGLLVLQNNRELQELTNCYTNLLKLPLDQRRRAIAHPEKEVSRLSMIESFEARQS